MTEQQILAILIPAGLSLGGSIVGTYFYLKYTVKTNIEKLNDHGKWIDELFSRFNKLDKRISKLIMLHKINHPNNPDVGNGDDK